MKTIVCDTTFLDGRERFEKGETRVVDDDRAAFFLRSGWVHEAGGVPAEGDTATTDTSLDVQSVTHNQESRHG